MNIYEPRKQSTLDSASSKILFITSLNPERREHICSLNHTEKLSNEVIMSNLGGQVWFLSLSINVKTRQNHQLSHCIKYEQNEGRNLIEQF